MDTEKMWYLFKPVLLEYLKNKKKEMEEAHMIPTLELLINELNEQQ